MNAGRQPPRVPAVKTVFEARSELVYFLDSDKTQAFVDSVAAHLDVDWFHRVEAGANELPAHYITTLYFDSETHEVARASECAVSGVRLRAREYCDQMSDQEIRREPLLWLEIKARSAGHTRKIRFAIPSHEIQAALCDGLISERLRVQSSVWGQSAEAVLREIGQLCMQTGPLKPDCMAHYRRRAWQDAGETLRVTLDTELAFYRAPSTPLWSGTTLADAIAEGPVARLSHSLVEIKARGEHPTWLRELIVAVGLEPASLEGSRAFSKFVAASHAVHSF